MSSFVVTDIESFTYSTFLLFKLYWLHSTLYSVFGCGIIAGSICSSLTQSICQVIGQSAQFVFLDYLFACLSTWLANKFPARITAFLSIFMYFFRPTCSYMCLFASCLPDYSKHLIWPHNFLDFSRAVCLVFFVLIRI